MITLTLNTAEFSRQIEELVKVTGKEASEVVREEGRLFVKDVVHLTPPFGTAPSTESLNAQKKIGEKAVERDIKRTFTVLDTTRIRDRRVRADLENAARKGNLEGIRIILRYCRIPVREVLLEIDPALHEQLRDRRGRVGRSKHIWVVRKRGLGAYIREKKSHVGSSKGGWNAAATALGLKLPGWITRHGVSGGTFRDETRHKTEPKITITNSRGSGGAELQIVQRAMQNRIRNIKAKLARIGRSGWKKS